MDTADLLAVDGDASRIRRQQSGSNIHKCGLSRTGETYDGNELAFVDRQVNVLENLANHLTRTERLGNVSDFYKCQLSLLKRLNRPQLEFHVTHHPIQEES